MFSLYNCSIKILKLDSVNLILIVSGFSNSFFVKKSRKAPPDSYDIEYSLDNEEDLDEEELKKLEEKYKK